MIKIGDRLPSSNLTEFVPFEGEGCSIGPAVVKLPDALAGKTVAIVAVQMMSACGTASSSRAATCRPKGAAMPAARVARALR